MATYKAPLRDMRFLLHETLDARQLADLPSYEDVSPELFDAVLEEAAKLAEQQFLPLNSVGDREGCRYDPEQHAVTTPTGFREAYRAFAAGGWIGLSADPNYGGQGLPHLLNMMVDEMACSTNISLSMYPGLSHSAILLLTAHAPEAIKQHYLPNMISGKWSGTMCLTEPQCGTDLGLIRTKAIPQSDGSYSLEGTKIWITGGEHDLTDNIVHLVLAKLPDAPNSVKGISLFLVPKYLANGLRNDIRCGGLEHKMGIKGSATCVMNLEGAKGWMIGEPNQGLRCMFTMMNSARLMVGMQGIGLGETAYQTALGFAKERLQSRSLAGPQAPDKPADPIIVHPDVRRMLLRQKAMLEGCRALAYWVGMQIDIAHRHPDAQVRQQADDRVQLLTPVVKAFLTDEGYNVCDQAIQVMGGSGYITEWGVEQLLRDARIARIYEGTNGIQALDLVGRKLSQAGGRAIRSLIGDIETFIRNSPGNESIDALKQSLVRLQSALQWLMQQGLKNPLNAGAAATPFLRLLGYTSVAWMWARMAQAAQQALEQNSAETAFYEGKLKTARFFMQKMLPETAALLAEIEAGAEPLMAHNVDEF